MVNSLTFLARRSIQGVVAVFLLNLLGCSTVTVRIVDLSAPDYTPDIPEHELLDVGVMVFDPNIPDAYDERVKRNLTPEIREAEARYMAYTLKNLLQSTGNWGAVRVLPRSSFAVDLVVSGKILHSDGERLIVKVKVDDARGETWIDNVYENLASRYAYEDTIPDYIDPYQQTYNSIANSMLEFRNQLSTDEIALIRKTAEVRFARGFSREAFGNHIVENDEDSTYELVRWPSDDDPMLRRVQTIREREYLFIDTLDEYYTNFSQSMEPHYSNWRAGTYQDAIDYRAARDRARARLLVGGAMIVSGAVMQRSSNQISEYTGYANVIGGAGYTVAGIASYAKAADHAGALRELGVSMAAEISPHTIELENEVVTLTGTVEEQYAQVRQILRRLFFEDYGLRDPNATDDDVDISAISPELQAELELSSADVDDLSDVEPSGTDIKD